MTEVKRFFFVQAPLGRVRHVCYSNRHVEGDRTACGLRMLKGWKWASVSAKREMKRLPLCENCEWAV